MTNGKIISSLEVVFGQKVSAGKVITAMVSPGFKSIEGIT